MMLAKFCLLLLPGVLAVHVQKKLVIAKGRAALTTSPGEDAEAEHEDEQRRLAKLCSRAEQQFQEAFDSAASGACGSCGPTVAEQLVRSEIVSKQAQAESAQPARSVALDHGSRVADLLLEEPREVTGSTVAEMLVGAPAGGEPLPPPLAMSSAQKDEAKHALVKGNQTSVGPGNTQPGKPTRGGTSPLWQVFALTGKSTTTAGKTYHEIQCLLPGCKAATVLEAPRDQSKRRWHLEKEHSLPWKQFTELSAAEIQSLLDTGSVPEQVAQPTSTPASQQMPSQRPLAQVVASGSAMQKRLTQSWARNMNAMGLMAVSHKPPLHLRRFLADLARETQALYVWQGSAGTSAHRVLRHDIADMWRRIHCETAKADLRGMVLHHDEWDDPMKKPWLGGALSYLSPDWSARCLVLFLAETQKWADSDMSGAKLHGACLSPQAVSSAGSWAVPCHCRLLQCPIMQMQR